MAEAIATHADATDAVSDAGTTKGPLVYRQSVWTRITHWVWAVCLFFLLLSGLQIFNAHPTLYIGKQSGFEFDNAVLKMYADTGSSEAEADEASAAENAADNASGSPNTQADANAGDAEDDGEDEEAAAGPTRGVTRIFGYELNTTGLFGLSGPEDARVQRGFPAWATIPSFPDLATGRVVHFFFAWVLVGTLLLWTVASLVNGHLRRDLVPTGKDIRALPRDIADHATLRFRHERRYGVLQKLSYGGVLFVVFPLIILTGLAMSPAWNAAWPWLLDVFGGRQTARTLHFVCMLLLVLFVIVHVVMVLLGGPINELRSMITGWYRTSPGTPGHEGDRP